MQPQEKNKRSILSNIAFVYTHMWRWHPESIAIFILNTLAVAILPFIWVVIPKLVIDKIQTGATMTDLTTLLLTGLIIAGLAYFTKEACVGVYRMKMSRIRMLFGLDLHSRAMRLDYHHVENPDTQNLLGKATMTTSNPSRGMGGVMLHSYSLLGYLIGFVGYVGILVSLHPLILVYLLLSVALVYWLTKKAEDYRYSLQDERHHHGRKARYLQGAMTDFEFGKDTRIYQLKDMLLGKLHFQHKKIEHIQYLSIKKFFYTDLVDILLVLIRDGLVLGYVTYLALKGDIGFGSFIMYITAIGGFAVWMQDLMKDFTSLRTAARYVDDYRDFMDIDNKPRPNPSVLPKGDKLAITFNQVNFAYPGTDKVIFEDLNLTIPPGQKLAVVGVNGAGKSTLIKLLTGLYTPTKGSITIQGTDISSLPLTDLYTLFSVVFQEIKPFAGSIAENIASSEDIDPTLLNSALEKSGLKSKVDRLEKGGDTPLLKVIDSSGIELSGGENQKLALARALYKNGPIVILDEPTAALDPIAEKDIYESFGDMIDGRTAIFISHRLSSTKFCDMVAYFEEGKIVEYGTHDDLMALNGKYAHMFNTQAQYYQASQNKEVG